MSVNEVLEFRRQNLEEVNVADEVNDTVSCRLAAGQQEQIFPGR